jgi:hypothetical protein
MRTTDISNSERVTAIWITASLRRLRPVGVEDFLRRHFRHHNPRRFRTKPADAVAANDKVRWIENMSLDEIQHGAINPRSLGLHQIENEFRRSVATLMHDPDSRVITLLK